jgi:hypothetical protein
MHEPEALRPDDPLSWLEHMGRNLIHVADCCLRPGVLKNNDAEHMRHLRREIETLINGLLRNPTNVMFWLKLVEDARTLGLLEPATTEGAQQLVKERRTQLARERKKVSGIAIDRAIRNALQKLNYWRDSSSNATARRILPEVNKTLVEAKIPSLEQDAVRKRIARMKTQSALDA